MKFVNTLENEAINGSTKDVVIKGVAIQTKALGSSLASSVWAIAEKQIATPAATE